MPACLSANDSPSTFLDTEPIVERRIYLLREAERTQISVPGV